MNALFKGYPVYKKILLSTLPLLFISCGMSFTYNGLQCPTNDMATINQDLAACRVYNIKDVDKALAKDPECKTCLEEKGYKIQPFNHDHNASK